MNKKTDQQTKLQMDRQLTDKDKWTFSGRLLSSSRIAVFVEECRGLPSSWRIATFVEDCHLRGRLRLRGVLPWEAGKGERGSGKWGKGKWERGSRKGEAEREAGKRWRKWEREGVGDEVGE